MHNYAALARNMQHWRKICSIGETYAALAKHMQNCSHIMNQPGDDDDGGRISPEHPSPILHAPRDNISRKDNPSLRHNNPH